MLPPELSLKLGQIVKELDPIVYETIERRTTWKKNDTDKMKLEHYLNPLFSMPIGSGMVLHVEKLTDGLDISYKFVLADTEDNKLHESVLPRENFETLINGLILLNVNEE